MSRKQTEEKFKALCIATKLARNNYIQTRDRAEKLYEELYGASPIENSDVYWNDHFVVTDGVSETPPDMREIEKSAILHTLILKK